MSATPTSLTTRQKIELTIALLLLFGAPALIQNIDRVWPPVR